MSKEVLGLSGAAAGVRDGEVVATANETSIGGTSVMTGERRVGVGGAFGGLERSESRICVEGSL